jgi:hypothetical protein
MTVNTIYPIFLIKSGKIVGKTKGGRGVLFPHFFAKQLKFIRLTSIWQRKRFHSFHGDEGEE